MASAILGLVCSSRTRAAAAAHARGSVSGRRASVDRLGQGRALVPGLDHLADAPAADALAQAADGGRHHRPHVRQRLVQHAALRGELGVRQDDEVCPVEEPGDLRLVDEPRVHLDPAPAGSAAISARTSSR